MKRKRLNLKYYIDKNGNQAKCWIMQSGSRNAPFYYFRTQSIGKLTSHIKFNTYDQALWYQNRLLKKAKSRQEFFKIRYW